jgi:hypothetical protein
MAHVTGSETFNDNDVFFEEPEQPTVAEPSSLLTCANCRRTDTTDFHITLSTVNKPIINRQYSMLPKDRDTELLLCELCSVYLTETLTRSKMWCFAWPSVMASLLSDEKYAGIQKDLWSNLPVNFQLAWKHLHRPTNDISTELTRFDDVTERSTLFNS